MKSLPYLTFVLAALVSACTPIGYPEVTPGQNPDQELGQNPGQEPGRNPEDDTDSAPTPPGEGGSQFETATIYYEDMDQTPSYYGYMDNACWHNAVGEGAQNISYASWNAKVRNDDYGSQGKIGTYEGASGKCYGRLTQASSGNYGYLEVSGISTCGYKDFIFSFGATQGPDVMKLEVSPDGNVWTGLEYSFSQSYNRWGQVSVSFSVGDAVEEIYLKLTLTGSSSQYGYGANIDDLKLVTAEGASNVVIGGNGGGGKTYPYAELPEFEDNDDYHYNTLYTKTVSSGKSVRNYSVCYDTRRHNPIWVAFPMHTVYTEGSGRSEDADGNDPWMQYPYLPLEDQSIIWDITGDGRHQYWTSSGSSYWGRGHLCMSSSRAGANKEINLQTFYPVNVAPQWTGGIFSDLWGKTESFHYERGTQICSDTLYVVAGCHYADDNAVEYDASYGRSDYSEHSKPCVMPTHQYKLFLRTRLGNIGKPAQECAAEELKAIGFWLDTVIPDGSSGNIADYAVSVAEIEEKTGITFFPDIPASVKYQCAPSDWGL